jgi:predicted amidohydrolase YtcJ
MIEKRHPTKFELDSVSTVNPIVLTHFSFHIVVANSLALEMVNYINASSSPNGGIIDVYPNGTLTGVCREKAMTALTDKFAKTFDQLTVE